MFIHISTHICIKHLEKLGKWAIIRLTFNLSSFSDHNVVRPIAECQKTFGLVLEFLKNCYSFNAIINVSFNNLQIRTVIK